MKTSMNGLKMAITTAIWEYSYQNYNWFNTLLLLSFLDVVFIKDQMDLAVLPVLGLKQMWLQGLIAGRVFFVCFFVFCF